MRRETRARSETRRMIAASSASIWPRGIGIVPASLDAPVSLLSMLMVLIARSSFAVCRGARPRHDKRPEACGPGASIWLGWSASYDGHRAVVPVEKPADVVKHGSMVTRP